MYLTDAALANILYHLETGELSLTSKEGGVHWATAKHSNHSRIRKFTSCLYNAASFFSLAPGIVSEVLEDLGCVEGNHIRLLKGGQEEETLFPVKFPKFLHMNTDGERTLQRCNEENELFVHRRQFCPEMALFLTQCNDTKPT